VTTGGTYSDHCVVHIVTTGGTYSDQWTESVTVGVNASVGPNSCVIVRETQ